MMGEAKLRSDWNKHVMQDVLAPLYALLLPKACLHLSQTPYSPYSILSLLPCPVPQTPWDIISKILIPLLAEKHIFYSHINGGCYLPLKDAVLLESQLSSVDFLAIKTSNNEIIDGNNTARLERLLLLEGLQVAVLPSDILPSLEGFCKGKVTPSFIRKHFSMGQGVSRNHPAINSLSSVREIRKGDLKIDDSNVRSEDLSNALFLMQYAFQDITSNYASYSSLQGLSILPLEDGSLGVIGDSTASPFYLVKDAERKLLHKAGMRIVIADSFLGPSVSACLRDKLCSEHCNIRHLSPIDTLKLLRLFVPQSWFDSSVHTVTNRDTIVNAEWLGWLWTYIVEENAIPLFEGVFPLLPIISPTNLPTGNYLAKISPLVPVLHMSFLDIPSIVVAALNDIGVYVALGGLGYSEQITRLVSESSPKGVLDALLVVSQRFDFHSIMSSWEDVMRRYI
jgi:hypothetical protein